MIRRQRSVFPLALLLLFEAVAIFALRAIGRDEAMQIDWRHLAAWSDGKTIDQLLPPIVLLVALVLAYWMLASTILTVLAAASRVPSFITATTRFTLPSVRRVVDGAMAASVLTTSIVGMLGASAAFAAEEPSATTGPTSTTLVDAQNNITSGGNVAADAGGGYFATPTLKVDPNAKAGAPAPTPSSTPAPTQQNPAKDTSQHHAPAAAATHVVKRGENLWTISRDHLADTKNTPASSLSESDIRGYWVKVVKANKDTLRSHDPHWIFPGETIKLP